MRIFTGAPLRSRERRRALDKFQSKTLRRNKAGASKVHRPCSGAGFWDEIAPRTVRKQQRESGRALRQAADPARESLLKGNRHRAGWRLLFFSSRTGTETDGQGPKRTDRDRNGRTGAETEKRPGGELQNGETACGPPHAAARRLPISHRFPSDLAGAGSRVCPQGHRSGQAA